MNNFSGAGILEAVEEDIRRAMVLDGAQSDPSRVMSDAAAHLVLNAGKRTRPRLIDALGEALRAPRRAVVDVAVAAELIHAASVLHDDVVDEGHSRRGRPTANVRWGNSVAVLAGDWVLTQAFRALSRHPAPLISSAVILVATMTRAAVREVEAREQGDLSLDGWRSIAKGKTGALFGWCLRSVGEIAGRIDVVRLEEVGTRLGVVFQMADDLRDLLDDPQSKDRFSDLRNRNPSYALATAAREPELNGAIRALWSRPVISAQEAADVGARIVMHGVASMLVEEVEHEVGVAIADVSAYLGPGLSNDRDRLEEMLLGRVPWRRAA